MNDAVIITRLMDLGINKKNAHLLWPKIIKISMDFANFKNNENSIEVLRKALTDEIEMHKNYIRNVRGI